MNQVLHPVCILTSGRGTRLGEYGASLNKALLPVDNKAALSHIIDHFPQGTPFVIALGHLGDQVKTYLELAHPDANFIFQRIENYDGPGSGPGLSLLTCKEHLTSPFYFVACDTLWLNKLDTDQNSDWFGVCLVPPEETPSYCNMKVVDGKISGISDKQLVTDPSYRAFVGLCFVKHYETFWSALESKDLVAGEHQISNGVKALVEKHSPVAVPIDWVDIGDKEKYEAAVLRFTPFNFAKSEEALYLINGRVIKYFSDPKITERRVLRARNNPEVFPLVESHGSGFLSYKYVEGRTLYEYCTPQVFERLLEWLWGNLWRPISVTRDEMASKCEAFYKDKTLARLGAFSDKYDILSSSHFVNGTDVPSVESLIKRVPWEIFSDGYPVSFHGDLQFDNILYDQKTRGFRLLDWRQDFAGETRYGDLYYDLAKLCGGLILNYDYIKRNLFSINEIGDEVVIDFAHRFQSDRFLEVLQSFVVAKELSWTKIKLLVPIIYLNMSPLHHNPFDLFLYHLGSSLLSQELDLLDQQGFRDIFIGSGKSRELRIDRI